MASVLIETGADWVRVVAFNGTLRPFINGRWLLEDTQVLCQWQVHLDGSGKAVANELPVWLK